MLNPDRLLGVPLLRIKASYPERVAAAREIRKANGVSHLNALLYGLFYGQSFYSGLYLSVAAICLRDSDKGFKDWLWAEVWPQVEAWEIHGLNYRDHCEYWADVRRGFAADQKRRFFQACEHHWRKVGRYASPDDSDSIQEWLPAPE